TKTYEDLVINFYFQKFITNINEHLIPTLAKKEVRILEEVQVRIDPTEGAHTINSDSRSRTITFGIQLIRSLVKFSVSELINQDTVTFDRRRFAGFFTSVYPHLSPNTYPEDAAELTFEQKSKLKRMGDTDEFSWVISSKVMF